MLEPTAIVHGACTGADAAAANYAVCNKIPEYPEPAEWTKYGRSAGPRRNRLMLDKHPDIDLVVAFPGAKGTANMVGLARSRGIKVLEVNHETR